MDRDLQFTIISERQISWETFYASFFYLLCWEELGEDYNLASYVTYVVFVNVIDKWRGTRSLKSIPNDRFFEKLFMPVFFYLPSEFLPEICWEEIGDEIFFMFPLIEDVWTRINGTAFIRFSLLA